jgi:hypothetical protein
MSCPVRLPSYPTIRAPTTCWTTSAHSAGHGVRPGTRMKVSEKGAVSVYGMGRFPVTLYKEQWLKLLNMSEEIRAVIAENEARLKAKG